MKRAIVLVTLLSNLAFADPLIGDFRMPNVVLDAIKHCECLKDNGVCNPYVIRINADEDIAKALDQGYAVNGHLIRCNSSQECVDQTQSLIVSGIVNLDLGPYQINYKYHPNPNLSEYFDFDQSREKANTILTKLVKSFGYSWETLGRYHHSPVNPEKNASYYRKMIAYIDSNSKKDLK